MSDIPEFPKLPVSSNEFLGSMETPATFANKFYISVSQSGVRITFAETAADVPPQMRSAVLMPLGDAIALRDVLSRMIADTVKEITPEELEELNKKAASQKPNQTED